MSIQKTHDRMDAVNRHITTKARGNIDVLAHKLGLHTAGAYKFLDEMRDQGFPIEYSKKEKFFYYSEKGKMVGYKFVREPDEEDPEDENSGGGGKTFLKIFSTSTYSRNCACNFGFELVTPNHFAWLKVTIQTSLMLQKTTSGTFVYM